LRSRLSWAYSSAG